MRVFDAYGRPVALAAVLRSGAEGTVYHLADDPAAVAKLYHAPPDADRSAKLAAMAALATPDLLRVVAWPTELLHATPGGRVVGFVQPKVVGHREVHQLYSPAQRKALFPAADFAFLAHVGRNTAAAFETVHAPATSSGTSTRAASWSTPRAPSG